MAITEESRHHLYQALERVLGSDQAATLMEHLPPVGWADVATKRDLDALGAATKRDIESLGRDIESLAAATKRDIESLEVRINARFSDLRADVYKELRTQMMALVGTNLTVGALVVATVRLL